VALGVYWETAWAAIQMMLRPSARDLEEHIDEPISLRQRAHPKPSVKAQSMHRPVVFSWATKEWPPAVTCCSSSLNLTRAWRKRALLVEVSGR